MLPARAISQFGDDLVLIVLLLRVFAAGHGPWSVTGLLLCAARPRRRPRPGRRTAGGRGPVQAARDRGRALAGGCCLGLAAPTPLGGYALVVLLQCGQVVSNPVWQALVPSIAGPDEVGRVMGAGQALNTLAAVAAPATAGLLVGTSATAHRSWSTRRRSSASRPRRRDQRTTRHAASAEPRRGACRLLGLARPAASHADPRRLRARPRRRDDERGRGLPGPRDARRGDARVRARRCRARRGVVVGSLLAGRNVPDARRGPRTALAALASG